VGGVGRRPLRRWGMASPLRLECVSAPSRMPPSVCLRWEGAVSHSKPMRVSALGLAGACVCARVGVMGVGAWMGRSGEDRLRELLIFYDPMQVVASELRRIADSLERLEISAEASVQIVSALRSSLRISTIYYRRYTIV